MIHLAPGHPSHLPNSQVVEKVCQDSQRSDLARYGLGEGDNVLRQVSSLRYQDCALHTNSPQTIKAVATEMKELYADDDDESPTKTSVDLSTDHVVITAG